MELHLLALSDIHPGVSLVARFAVLQLLALRDLLIGVEESHPGGGLR